MRFKFLSYCRFQFILVCRELESTGKFSRMNKKVDEDEHSIEMHLPYIAKVMQRYGFESSANVYVQR